MVDIPSTGSSSFTQPRVWALRRRYGENQGKQLGPFAGALVFSGAGEFSGDRLEVGMSDSPLCDSP